MKTTARKHLSIWRYACYLSIVILLLCNLTLILSSCQKGELPGSNGTGKKIAVSFTLSDALYEENGDIITRSYTVPEPETVAVPIVDGLYMYATLEANGEEARTRAQGDPFSAGTKICVVAYQGNTYKDHAIYTVNSYGSLTRNQEWMLEAGTYNFVVYTYAGADEATMQDIHFPLFSVGTPVGSFAPVDDLLWGRSATTATISEENKRVSISMEHLFSRITQIQATTDPTAGKPAITAISGVTVESYRADLNLREGTLNKRTDAADIVLHAIANNKWGTFPSSSISTDEEILVYSGSGTIINIASVSIQGYSNPFTNVSTTFNTQLLGNHSYTLKVSFSVMAPVPPSVGEQVIKDSYVGAFWRAGEKGERIICIPVSGANAGPWTATVAWVDARWSLGDILLDAGASSDQAIYTANPGNAENYPVHNGSQTINGNASNGQIVFRIGLKNHFTAPVFEPENPDYITSFPTRYAVVLIYYGTNKSQVHKIYLRQGEGADYLMTNNDPVSTGGLSSRTSAKRFMPYNLTASTLDADAGVRGGEFTEYPTQTGTFWQWYHPEGTTVFYRTRWAWNPHNSTISSAMDESWQKVDTDLYWNTIENTQETCPAGYRRPTDGSITDNESCISIPNSEMRHSLFYNPKTGYNNADDISNSVWGYYADGFFDRRQIVNAKGLSAENSSATSVNDRYVAYIGRLFFNPVAGSDHYCASLFFPTTGVRYYSSGELKSAGNTAYYWTSSANNSQIMCGLGLLVTNTQAGMWRIDQPFGSSIRCVRE